MRDIDTLESALPSRQRHRRCNPGTARIRAAFGTVEFLSNQPAVPSHDGVRESDRSNLLKVLAAKPLADLGGKPMVVRVCERAAQSGAAQPDPVAGHLDGPVRGGLVLVTGPTGSGKTTRSA